jgi:TRAP transporter TAXI family solute receptor
MKILAAAVLTGLVFAGCDNEPAITASVALPRTIRLVHTWQVDATGMDRLRLVLNESLHGMRSELNRAVSESAVKMLQRDEIDAAFTYANMAYMASSGQLQTNDPTDHIRAIAELPIRAVQVLVGPHSGITSVSGLRGKHVSLGSKGGSAAPVAELVLRAYGIALKDLNAEQLDLDIAAHKVVTGELDAGFSYGYPNPDVAAAIRQGGRILEIVGTEIDQFRTTYPLLKPTVIPAGTYPAMNHPIHTVGIDGIFICRTNLDDDTVYELTRAFVEVVAGKDLGIETLKHMNLGSASSTAIPLHSGAARYYRERELLP